jgi:hypothetical protein
LAADETQVGLHVLLYGCCLLLTHLPAYVCCAGLRKLALLTADGFEAACCANAAWLEDVIMHLLCVLALDRFADYVSDQVGFHWLCLHVGTCVHAWLRCMLLRA